MKRDEFLTGVVDWIDKNIVSVFPERSLSRFMAYAALPVLRDKANRLIDGNAAMLKEQGVLDGDDVDLDAVELLVLPAMEKAGAVDLVFLGMKFSIKPQNLESMLENLRG